MLASRIAALTIATGALVASAGPAFAAYGGGDGSSTTNGSTSNSTTTNNTMPNSSADSSTNGTTDNTTSGTSNTTNPHPVAPGSSIWITDGFTESFCPSSDMSAVAKSDGFKNGSIDLTRGGTFKGLAGKGDAVDKPGSYAVSVTCASGKTSAANFQTLVVSPKGAAATGDGASILGSGANDATGLALLGGALALGTVVVRRKAKAER